MDRGRTITLASRNAKKAVELRALVGDGWDVRGLGDCPGVPEVEEDGATFLENAAKKAVEVSRHVVGLVLADDSGLEVDARGGAPGGLSARFAGNHGDDASNNAMLLGRLDGVAAEGRGAQFRCVLALARSGEVLFTCEGVCRGWIGFAARGERGFGYDPLFVPEWEVSREGGTLRFGRTFAEIGAEEKNRRSHRARAMDLLRNRLADLG
ncbi:MAG: non-canonical purine NTP pyrophosphatase [Verrucomicrobiae bacterium]|nr:non-canonical purine NTP pyrophosphatase [Verrucomicrobiae bacterium]